MLSCLASPQVQHPCWRLGFGMSLCGSFVCSSCGKPGRWGRQIRVCGGHSCHQGGERRSVVLVLLCACICAGVHGTRGRRLYHVCAGGHDAANCGHRLLRFCASESKNALRRTAHVTPAASKHACMGVLIQGLHNSRVPACLRVWEHLFVRSSRAARHRRAANRCPRQLPPLSRAGRRCNSTARGRKARPCIHLRDPTPPCVHMQAAPHASKRPQALTQTRASPHPVLRVCAPPCRSLASSGCRGACLRTHTSEWTSRRRGATWRARRRCWRCTAWAGCKAAARA